MNLKSIKYHTCSEDNQEGILMVDPETESVPVTDADGNILYYCTQGNHVFSTGADAIFYLGDREETNS
ncbi:MAG: hypothetical protein M3Y81_11205 [Chloroflexota bacterium]|nr:hypothetical protein [Chloroflexota bacterium]